MRYRLVVPFRFWWLFAITIITTGPIALYLFVPITGAIVGAATFVVVMGQALATHTRRLSLLKRGEVAQVTNVEVSRSATSYSNVRLSQAHGWNVTRRFYTGPGYHSRISYEVSGSSGTLTFRGLAYAGGVVLADPRRPGRALCVHQFPYPRQRDPSGNWTGAMPARVLVLSMIMFDIVLAWAVAMIWIWGLLAAPISSS